MVLVRLQEARFVCGGKAAYQPRALDVAPARFADHQRPASAEFEKRVQGRLGAGDRNAGEAFLALEHDGPHPEAWFEQDRPELLAAGVDPFGRTARFEMNIHPPHSA